jgi:glyoxylase-like metal-dependent hydrolase (beta-lactamase superfamily II)
MKQIAGAMILAVVAAISPPNANAQQYAPLTKPLKIEQVPGHPIYYSIGNPGIPGKVNEGNTSNAGFVVTPEGVVVFDALGTPSLGWALLQEIRKITDKPVRYNVLSHYHADHIYRVAGVSRSHRGRDHRPGPSARIQCERRNRRRAR